MKNVPIKYESFPLVGGLDLLTPTAALEPGVARDSLNFEESPTGGRSRIYGYERTDGRVGNPSDAQFSAMTLTTLTGVTVGGAISNGTGATGTVFIIVGLLVFYTQAVGTFSIGNTINAGPLITSLGASLSPRTTAQYIGLAANVYRALITPVPGDGPVRGVALLNSVLYAWRDNTTASPKYLGLFKATTAGWTRILFPWELSFTASGTTPINDGDAITQGAITGTVARVVLETGTWAAGTAAGRLLLSASVGLWVGAGNIQVGGLTRATVTPPAGTATYLAALRSIYLPTGTVQTDISNFGGAQPTKMYGCDGVNRGFEFDGTTLVPIRTGMVNDAPNNVQASHKNTLWFTFGPSLQGSSLGFPYQWTPLLGALELVNDGFITALQVMPGTQQTGAMAVFTDQSTHILYGSSGSYSLVFFNNGLGAGIYTVQNLEQTVMLDARGVVNMSATLNFGNFDVDTLTYHISPWIQPRRGTATCSSLHRSRSQYRVFFADGSALYCTIVNGNFKGAMPVLFPNVVRCWCEGSTTSTTESSFFGSDDGFVRRMDVGTSFDGVAIPFRFTLNFDSVRSPRTIKRFRKIALEMQTSGYTEFDVGYTLAYSDTQGKDQAPFYTYATSFAVPQWDVFTWDNFIWDGRNLGPIEVGAQGSGENIAIALQGTTDVWAPFTINAAVIHYTPRRGKR